jgi:hypothetical protein
MTTPGGTGPYTTVWQTGRGLRLPLSQEHNNLATTRRSRLSGAVPIRDPRHTPNQRLPATREHRVAAVRPRRLSPPRHHGINNQPLRKQPAQLGPRPTRPKQIPEAWSSRTWGDLRTVWTGDEACCTPLTHPMAISLKSQRQEVSHHRCRSKPSRRPTTYPLCRAFLAERTSSPAAAASETLNPDFTYCRRSQV